MGTFNHNKKRNAGLVYEFLVRHISQAMVGRDERAYQTALGLVRKYYGDGTPLSEERELFTVIQSTRGVSESAARRVLGEVQRQACMTDTRKLEIKQSNLIKEANHSFGRGFWDMHRVPDYRLLATIQMVLDATRSEQRLTESVQNIQLEEGLVGYMTSTAEFAAAPPPQEDIDQLVMAITAKKFQEKYTRSLNAPQQRLLQEYIRAQVTGDDGRLDGVISEERERVMGVLTRAETQKEFVEDPEMLRRLQEARQQMTGHGERDKLVEDLMLYQSLAEEIESDA